MEQEIMDNATGYLLDIVKLGIIAWGILRFPQRFSKKWTILILFSMLGCNIAANAIPITNIRHSIMIIISILAISMNVKSIRQSFLCILLYFLQTIIDELMLIFVFMLISNEPIELLFSRDTAARQATLISDSIVILFYLLLWYIIRNKKDRKIKSINAGVSLLGALGVFLFIRGFTFIIKYGIGFGEEDYEKLTVTGCLIIGTIFILLVFYLFYVKHKEESYRERMRFSQEQMEYQKHYYESLLNKENETKRFRHDMKAHMNCLMGLLQEGKTEDAKHYLLDISNTASTMEKKIDTGNKILDFISSNIIEQYPWISLQWKGAFPDEVKISDIDLCILFSNLLKNSCEAQELYKKKTTGDHNTDNIVRVFVKNFEGDLFFSIENNIQQGEIFQGLPGKTSKREKESHGYGLYNIYQVVQKYDGKIEYKQEGELVIVEIYFGSIIKQSRL